MAPVYSASTRVVFLHRPVDMRIYRLSVCLPVCISAHGWSFGPETVIDRDEWRDHRAMAATRRQLSGSSLKVYDIGCRYSACGTYMSAKPFTDFHARADMQTHRQRARLQTHTVFALSLTRSAHFPTFTSVSANNQSQLQRDLLATRWQSNCIGDFRRLFVICYSKSSLKSTSSNFVVLLLMKGQPSKVTSRGAGIWKNPLKNFFLL